MARIVVVVEAAAADIAVGRPRTDYLHNNMLDLDTYFDLYHSLQFDMRYHRNNSCLHLSIVHLNEQFHRALYLCVVHSN